MNEPSWLAQLTASFTNNILLPLRYADYSSPLKTGLLTLAIFIIGWLLWKQSKKVKKPWGKGVLLILATIAGINVATILLISATVWGPF
ncbi:hypothetical protein QM996_11480 [Sinorhizobium chiapasense]